MNTEVLSKVIDLYGKDHQIIKAVEELTELSLALQHYRQGRCDWRAVIEEMADVHIMLEQLNLILEGKEEVNYFIKKKLDRLTKLVSETSE